MTDRTRLARRAAAVAALALAAALAPSSAGAQMAGSSNDGMLISGDQQYRAVGVSCGASGCPVPAQGTTDANIAFP